MTLEEKAKEYCEEYFDEFRMTVGDMENAYIAGTTENGIIWHDLRKNPDDLPKRLKTVWVKTEYDDYCEGYWWPERNRWQDSDMGDGESIGAVVAWCEIPKFKGE